MVASDIFLSVLTRTQGKRNSILKETLESLAQQRNRNFEVMIVGHNVLDGDKRRLLELIDTQPEWMKEKIRYIPVDGGNRSTPLNKGFEEANGSYVAILDDDDIVYDNWVDSFWIGAQDGKGSVIHSYIEKQNWSMELMANGDYKIEATGPLEDDYCKKFDWIKQFHTNMCPVHGLAYPRVLYSEHHLTFDETLDTTEDWDFLMHAASFVGVHDVPVKTGIYKIWDTSSNDNSASLHSDDEWEQNRERVLEKFQKLEIRLPKGYATIFENIAESDLEHMFLEGGLRKAETHLYPRIGKKYSDSDMHATQNIKTGKNFKFVFSDLNDFHTSDAFRWDPTENGMMYLQKLSIILKFTDDSEFLLTLKDVKHNGVKLRGGLFFITKDPQIIFKINNSMGLSSIIFEGKWQKGVDDETLFYLLKRGRFFPVFKLRLINALKKLLKSIKK